MMFVTFAMGNISRTLSIMVDIEIEDLMFLISIA
jgi:hypothetical protein